MGCGSCFRVAVAPEPARTGAGQEFQTIDDSVSALQQQLNSWGLSQALEFLTTSGYKTPDDLRHLRESDLDELQPLFLRRKLWDKIRASFSNPEQDPVFPFWRVGEAAQSEQTLPGRDVDKPETNVLPGEIADRSTMQSQQSHVTAITEKKIYQGGQPRQHKDRTRDCPKELVSADSRWVTCTVRSAGCFELKNWPPNTDSVSGAPRYVERLTKLGSPYPKECAPCPYPGDAIQGVIEDEAGLPEHYLHIVFDDGKIKGLSRRMELHTSPSRMQMVIKANAWQPNKAPPRNEDSHDRDWDDSVGDPAAVMSKSQCCCHAIIQGITKSSGGCSKHRCVLAGVVSEGRWKQRPATYQVRCRVLIVNQDLVGGHDDAERAKKAWVAFMASRELGGIKKELASRTCGTPLWALYMAKYGSSQQRPALCRYKCNTCDQTLPPSKIGMSDMYTRESKCRNCQRMAARRRDRARAEVQVEVTTTRPARTEDEQPKQKQTVHPSEDRSRIAMPPPRFEVEVSVDHDEQMFEKNVALLQARIRQQREVTIFLSSPFQGLLIERAELVGKYLPELALLCERRGVILRTVDLRWGITSAMSKNNLTVRTCLQAMDGSDVFVGFYGQRYGASQLQDGNTWIKPALENCYLDYPWIQNLSPCNANGTTNKSVTHLEFEAGFNDGHRHGGSVHAPDAQGPVLAYSFFRAAEYDARERDRCLPNDESQKLEWKHRAEIEENACSPLEEEWRKEEWKYRAENKKSGHMLQMLQDEVKKWALRGRGAMYRYAEPKSFAERAFEDLNKLLDRILPPVEAGEDEDLMQRNHIIGLTRVYAPQQAEAELEKYLFSTASKPLAITAMPGGGKSALLAKALLDHSDKDGWSSIYHFVGINARSTELAYTMERLVLQMAALLKCSKSDKEQALRLPPTKQMGWVVGQWQTGRARAEGRLLVIVDALNELENSTDDDETSPHRLEWLLRKSQSGVPQPLPSGVKIVVSSLGKCEEYPSGKALQVMMEQKFPIVKLQPVRSADQCKAMVDRLLKQAHKKLDYKKLNFVPVLLSTDRRANPLFITLFVLELVSFNGYKVSAGVFEQLPDYCTELQGAETITELLDIVFRRLDTLHTAPELIEPLPLGKIVEIEPSSSSSGAVSASRSLYRLRIEPTGSLRLAECGCRVLLPGHGEAMVVSVISPSEFMVNVDAELRSAGDHDGVEVLLIRPGLVCWVMQLIWATKEGLTPLELEELVNLLLLESGLRVHTKNRGADGAGNKLRTSSRPHLGAVVEILDAAGMVYKSGTITGVGKRVRVRCDGEDVWVSPSRLKVTEVRAGKIEQEHLTPLLAGMHRMLSKNSGLLNFGHDYVRLAVESKYLAFCQGRISGVMPLALKTAVRAGVSRLHATMAEYFKEKAEVDQTSKLDELPRAIREKNHHEALSGKKPTFLVVARVRPFIQREIDEHLSNVFVSVRQKQMCLKDPISGQPKAFTLDCCLSEEELQQDLWRRAGGSELVDKILQGYNVSVLAYGQTGSGKTYTMFGHQGDGHVELGGDGKGVIPRLIQKLFQGLEKHAQRGNGVVFSVEMAAVEVYMDIVRDLLSESTMAIRVLDCAKGTVMKDLTKQPVATSKDAIALVKDAFLKRKVCSTSMNDYSSRSHIIVTLHVRQTIKQQDGHLVLKAEVNLVDLAGSERGRTRKTDTDFWKGVSQEAGAQHGVRKEREVTSINQSLMVLQKVISKLAAGHKHVPYKEAKLTRILSNSLGGNALTVLITALSPSPKDFAETESALRYAREAKKILNQAAQNAERELVESAVQNKPAKPILGPHRIDTTLVACMTIQRNWRLHLQRNWRLHLRRKMATRIQRAYRIYLARRHWRLFRLRLLILQCAFRCHRARHATRMLREDEMPEQGRTYTMFHGTSPESAALIEQHGFRPSSGGLLGPGVYLSRDVKKARMYSDRSARGLNASRGVVLEVEVELGRVCKIDDHPEMVPEEWTASPWHDAEPPYDSAWVSRDCPPTVFAWAHGRSGKVEEDCVWDPEKVKVIMRAEWDTDVADITSILWMFEDDEERLSVHSNESDEEVSGRWVSFSKESSFYIESHYRVHLRGTGKAVVRTHIEEERKRFYQYPDTYDIDFALMKQTNVVTRYRRRLRRIDTRWDACIVVQRNWRAHLRRRIMASRIQRAYRDYLARRSSRLFR